MFNRNGLIYTKKIFSSIFIKFFFVGVSFLTFVYITHNADKNVVGDFILFLSITSFLGVIFRLGHEHEIIRTLSGESISDNISIYSWGVIKKVTIFYFIIFIFALVIGYTIENFNIVLVLFTSYFISISHVVGIFFQSKGKVNLLHAFQGGISQSIFMFFLFLLSYFSYSFHLELVIGSLVFAWFFSFLIAILSWNFSFKFNFIMKLDLLTSVNKNKYVIFINLLNQLVQWVVPVGLSLFVLKQQVAEYFSSYKLAMLTAVVLIACNSLFASNISRIIKTSKESLESFCYKINAIIFGLMLPLLLALFLYSDELLTLYGDGYNTSDSILVLKIICIGQMYNVLTGSVGVILNMSNMEDYVFKASLISSFTLIGAGIILIPLFGIVGAAVSLSLSIFNQMTYMSIIVYREFGFCPIQFLYKWSK